MVLHQKCRVPSPITPHPHTFHSPLGLLSSPLGMFQEIYTYTLARCAKVWNCLDGKEREAFVAVGGVPLCPLLMGDLNRGRMGGLNGWEEPFGLHQWFSLNRESRGRRSELEGQGSDCQHHRHSCQIPVPEAINPIRLCIRITAKKPPFRAKFLFVWYQGAGILVGIPLYAHRDWA